MTILFDQLFLLAVLSATTHWLIARADITKPLWSRAPGFLDRLLRCPSCSGFWIGGGFGALGVRPVYTGSRWTEILFAAILGVLLTPVVQAVHLWALDRTKIEEPIDVTAHAVNEDNEPYDNDDQITPPDLPSTRTRSGS